MRRAARVDANQIAVVKALRQAGATVQHLHNVGGGCPDLVAGLRGRNILLEVKMPGKGLNELETDWFCGWAGQAHVVRSPEEAVRVVMLQAEKS